MIAKFQMITLCSFLAATSGVLFAEEITSIPEGSLTAAPRHVAAGTRPNVSWQITYPQIQSVVDIGDDDTIRPTEDLTMKVRVLGAEIGPNRYSYWRTQAQVKVGGSSWQKFFDGTHRKVVPDRVLHTREVRAGQRIFFRSRVNTSYRWLSYRETGTSTQNVVALVDGEEVPTNLTSAFTNQASISSVLRNYVDENGRIDIGPRDVIILTELYSTSVGTRFFDMQDMVLLVTFE